VLRATNDAFAGRVRPMGREFETPDLLLKGMLQIFCM